MPNWVLSKINASNEVINALKNDKGEIDFNTVLPRPAIFKEFGEFIPVILRSDLENLVKHLNAKDKENGLEPLSERLANTPADKLAEVEKQARESIEREAVIIDKIDAKDLALQAYCKLITGSSDPLDWSTEHWGTKWNATEVIIDDKYLEIISVEYADEDLGYNCGSFSVKNGVIINDYLNTDNVEYEVSRRFACELWGYNPDEEDDE